MVRWTYKPEDYENLLKEYGKGEGVLAFAENKRYTNFQLAKIYALILNDKEIRVVWLNLNLEKKEMTVIPLDGMEKFKVTGRGTKHIKIKTADKKFNLLVHSGLTKIRPYQQKFMEHLMEAYDKYQVG